MTNTKNAFERLAIRFSQAAMSELIGGNENVLLDYLPDDEEYKRAYKYLHSGREALVEDIYRETMITANDKAEKIVRFAGSEFIKNYISDTLKTWGY